MANINLDLNNNVIFEKSKDTRTYLYRDIGTKNLKVTTNSDNSISVKTDDTSLYDEAAVKNAINNIFSFIPGEEILDPEFGNSLYRYLYKPVSEEIAIVIKRELIELLGTYEPRITINDIVIETNADENIVKIQLKYVIDELDTNYITDIEF